MNLLTSLFFLSSLAIFSAENLDYYWRDYVGDIPDDAFPGGQDRNHISLFIGQVFIPKHGLLPAQIERGVKSVTTSKSGIHTSDVFVKILCSNAHEKLSWIPTTSSTFLNDTAGKSVVVGGAENGKVLNIGRVSYQGEIIVGKVCSYEAVKAMYFPYQGKELGVASYELLIYEKTQEQ